MADINHAIKLYKVADTDKRVGINVTDNDLSLKDTFYVEGRIGATGMRLNNFQWILNSDGLSLVYMEE